MKKEYNKIVEALAKNKILIFKPKTEKEAALIQKGLFNLGVEWAGIEGSNIIHLNLCVSEHMIVDCHRKLYYNPQGSSIENGVLCDLSDFELDIDPADIIGVLSGDDLLREVFNQLSARIGNLEDELQEAKSEISKINNSIAPRALNKNKFG